MPQPKLFTRILLTLAFSLLLLPQFALAAATVEPPQLEVPIPGMPAFQRVVPQGQDITSSWIAEYIVGVYRYSIGLLGITAMIAIAVGGAMIVVGGDAKRIGDGWDWVKGGVTGLALGLGSYLILNMINTDLVNFKAITVQGLKDPTPIAEDFTGGGGELTPYNGKGQASFTKDVITYDPILKKYGADCTLLKAIMMAESNGNPSVTSPQGAQGLMQIKPTTFKSLNVGTNAYDATQSISGAAKYISILRKSACNGAASNGSGCTVADLKYIIAAYNGGPGANKVSLSCLSPAQTIWECTSNPGFAETRKYVDKVIGNMDKISKEKLGCS